MTPFRLVDLREALLELADRSTAAQAPEPVRAPATKTPKPVPFDLDAVAAKFKAAGADHPSCSGPVTLVKDKCERYATVTGLSTGDVLVDWPMGVHHLFPCDGGTCVQSEHGTMRGWRIHPDELPRFQAKVVGNRVVRL